MEKFFKILLVALFFSFSAIGQQYTPMTAAGYQMKRIKADSSLHLPSFCGVPTLLNSTAKQGALAIDTCGGYLYMWTNANGWDTVNVSGGGGGNQDFQSVLDNGNFAYNKDINLYGKTSANQIYLSGMDNNYMPFMALGDSIGGAVYTYTYPQATIEFQNKYQSQKLKQQDSIRATIYLPTQNIDAIDTLATLKNVRNGSSTIDTTSLSNRINTKLSISDSTTYYTKFRSDSSRTNIYTTINTKLNKSDSTIYQTKFRSDSARTNTYNAINSKLNLSDSTIYQTKFCSDSARTNIYTAINTKLNKTDTANAFLISVSQPNDSSLTFVKGTTSTNYIIRASVAGSATRMITQVYNKSGATITKGSVIYIDGAHSSILPSIALAKANTEETSAYTYGLVENDIPNNSQGVVIQSGVITNLNLPTSSYNDGQTLYLSPTVAGGYTTTKPLAPNHYVAIGTIVRAHPNFGTIIVAIRNGFQLDEMSDVKIALVPNDSTLLQFSRVDSLWHDVSVTNAIGNKYLKPSDSTTYQTKFRSDSSRTNIYTSLASKIGTSDTSVFQRKTIAAYSFQANNTASSANSTSVTYKDVAVQTLSGGITWTGTAPSGTTNHSYRWNQIGKLVTFNATLIYGTAGVTNTQVTIALPSDLPTPESPTGLTAATEMQYFGSGTMNINKTGIITVTRPVMLRRNAANNGYEVIMTQATALAVTFVTLTIQYFAQ